MRSVLKRVQDDPEWQRRKPRPPIISVPHGDIDEGETRESEDTTDSDYLKQLAEYDAAANSEAANIYIDEVLVAYANLCKLEIHVEDWEGQLLAVQEVYPDHMLTVDDRIAYLSTFASADSEEMTQFYYELTCDPKRLARQRQEVRDSFRPDIQRG